MVESQYSLGEVLGEGKFSKVYKGYKKTKPEEVLAIKVMNLERLVSPPPVGHGPIYRKYWNREIDVMKALQGHPNIVCLEGIESFDDKIVHIAMEFCNKDLKTFLEKDRPQRKLSEKEAQICMRQLANAFKFMCGFAIAHRDLKPQNILVTTHPDGTFVLKLSDFGFARKMEKETNMQASVLGTPLYMAPEVQKRKYSDTCDLWSLGVILYEMLCGFQGLSVKVQEFYREKIATILEKETFSDDCKNLLVALLQPDPAKRISMLDFFSHPFIIEPHPEASLLSYEQLSQLEGANTIQVFIYPKLENTTLAFDDKQTVWEWKQKSGLREDDLLVLCRDTTTNKSNTQERWSGVELRDYENLESYQIGELGSANKCIFVFRKDADVNPEALLSDLQPTPIMVPTNLPVNEFFERCKAFVAELNIAISAGYDTCSKFVLVRELMLCALRALCTVIKSKKGDLEADVHKAHDSLEPHRRKWNGLRATFTQTCSIIDTIPAIALPEFLRPKPAMLTELNATKQRELDEQVTMLKKIDAAFATAKQSLVLQLPSNISLDERLKTMLNRDIYECKKNCEQFKHNFERASTISSDNYEGEEKEAYLAPINFSEVLTQKVLKYHKLCKENVGQAMDIASDISKVLDHHSKLSKMSDPTTTESHSIPNIERAINSFSTSLQSLSEFNALPELVDRVVRLLQERQNYEIMMSRVVPRASAMLQQLFQRYDNLAETYAKDKEQIDKIFPNFSQISALPYPSASLNPEPALNGYPKISGNLLPVDLDADFEFSFICPDNMSMSDLLRDNGVMAEKLRIIVRERDDLQASLSLAEARAGVGAGDLARRVALYERMAALKNAVGNHKNKDFEGERQTMAEKIKNTEEESRKEIETYKKQLEEETKKAERSKKEVQAQMEISKKMHAEMEELRRRSQEENKRVATLQKAVEEARAQTQHIEQLRAQGLESMHTQASENASLRAQVREIESLRAQARRDETLRGEVESLRALAAQESEARHGAEEVSLALTKQVALLRDNIMAYQLSYAQDIQQQPPPPAPQT